MLGILDSFCGGIVVGIEVGNNLSCGSFLLLLLLGDHKLLDLLGCRHSLEACALHKLLDILLLNEIVNMLIGNGNNAICLNLSLGISGLAYGIHPTADNLSGIGCLCDARGIRTNDLLLTSFFFLINSSGFNFSTLCALNCIAIVGVSGSGYTLVRLLRLSRADEGCAGCLDRRKALELAGYSLSRALCLNDTLGERTVCRGNCNCRLGLTHRNTGETGDDHTLTCKVGCREAYHGLLLLLSIALYLGDLITRSGGCVDEGSGSICLRLAHNHNLAILTDRGEYTDRSKTAVKGYNIALRSSGACFLTELNDLLASGSLCNDDLVELRNILGIGEGTLGKSCSVSDKGRKICLNVVGKVLSIGVCHLLDGLTGSLFKLLSKLVVNLNLLVKSGVKLSRLSLIFASYSGAIAIAENSDNLTLMVKGRRNVLGLRTVLGIFSAAELGLIVFLMLLEISLVILELSAKLACALAKLSLADLILSALSSLTCAALGSAKDTVIVIIKLADVGKR